MHSSRTGGGKSKLENATIGKPLFISSVVSVSAGPADWVGQCRTLRNSSESVLLESAVLTIKCTRRPVLEIKAKGIHSE